MKLKQIWQAGKWGLIVGAIIGAGASTIFGLEVLGRAWGIIGLGGAILGAIAGLDILLPAPRRTGISGSGRSFGPFSAAAGLALVSFISLVFGLYSWGGLTFSCQRLENHQVDCRRTTFIWLGQVKDNEQLYEQVRQARQATSDLVVMTMMPDEYAFLYGFGWGTADQINRFIDSKEQTLLIKSDNLWFFPLIFLGTGLVTLGPTIVCFRSAIQKLNNS